jgi:hypothetical protein
MSTILKALKKLENEQRAAAAPVDLPGKILVDGPPARHRPKPGLWVGAGIAAGLIIAILVVTGFFWWREFSAEVVSTKATPPPTALAATPIPTDAPGHPLRPGKESVALPVTRRHDPSSATALPAAAVVGAPKGLASPPTLPLPAEGGAGPSSVTAQASSSPVVKQVHLEKHEIPAPGQQWAAPHLTVSDIVPASGGGRMAIVNGLPVMEGTMVDDAVVREIRAGQVVFEIDGKSVAVPLAARP